MGYVFRNATDGADLSATGARHISVTATMTSATWNTVASHEVFTVTGLVRARMWIECTTNLASTGDGAQVQFGVEGVTNGFIAATNEDALDQNDIWYDASPTVVYDTTANTLLDYVVNGLDIGYEITGEALTAGVLVFHCVWEPMNATGNVAAGAGGAL
jgi:hypothetical protein